MREEENIYTVSINVEVRQKYGMSGGLSVREEITVNAHSFMEIAAILAKSLRYLQNSMN